MKKENLLRGDNPFLVPDIGNDKPVRESLKLTKANLAPRRKKKGKK